MTEASTSKVEELKRFLKKNIEEIGTYEFQPDEDEITKFCELIGDNNLIYLNDKVAIEAGFEGKIIPASYITSLTNPMVQLILTKDGPQLFSRLVKAFIHVGSEIELLKPMIMNKKHRINVELSEPIKKSGKKGVYYNIMIKLAVLDEYNTTCVIDNHDCFFKL